MQLPEAVIKGLNLSLSRHKDPLSLDWQLVRGKWTAREGDRQFQVVEFKDDYVIAETKSTSHRVGADLK